MNRRDLLKFFAAGTVIAPVSGCAPLVKLIEVPKVELVVAAKIPEPFDMWNVNKATVIFDMIDGTRHRLTVNDVYHRADDVSPRMINPAFDYMVELRISHVLGASPQCNYFNGSIDGCGRFS